MPTLNKLSRGRSEISEPEGSETSGPASKRLRRSDQPAIKYSWNWGPDIPSEDCEGIITNPTLSDDKHHSLAKSASLKHEDNTEDCVILEAITKSYKHSTTEQLSTEAMARTSFIVTASNQPTIAPVTVPFTSCMAFDRLFETLISECDIRLETAQKVTKISAKNTWTGKQIRIRKGRPEDWMFFHRGLCKAWKQGSEQFEDGCEVEMMIHVDD